jgi:hypothetical protein
MEVMGKTAKYPQQEKEAKLGIRFGVWKMR